MTLYNVKVRKGFPALQRNRAGITVPGGSNLNAVLGVNVELTDDQIEAIEADPELVLTELIEEDPEKELTDYTVEELKVIATKLGVEVQAKPKKADLIKAIEAKEAEMDEEESKESSDPEVNEDGSSDDQAPEENEDNKEE